MSSLDVDGDGIVTERILWLSSMNAPVMVELEGETDPLEVNFVFMSMSFKN